MTNDECNERNKEMKAINNNIKQITNKTNDPAYSVLRPTRTGNGFGLICVNKTLLYYRI